MVSSSKEKRLAKKAAEGKEPKKTVASRSKAGSKAGSKVASATGSVNGDEPELDANGNPS
ncbi:hypothetical protein MCOR02_004510 [Pyricularia oryzae]|nr:hypothetical protein MCOR02_004510 [Pyricularia oryzae]